MISRLSDKELQIQRPRFETPTGKKLRQSKGDPQELVINSIRVRFSRIDRTTVRFKNFRDDGFQKPQKFYTES